MSGPHLNLPHAQFWSLKREISMTKLFCRASAREDSSPEEENKALSRSPLSQVASWQLVRHPCYILQLKYSFSTGTLSHERLRGGAGVELKPPENLQQVLIMGLVGMPKPCPPTLIPTKTTTTIRTGICPRARPYPVILTGQTRWVSCSLTVWRLRSAASRLWKADILSQTFFFISTSRRVTVSP